MLLKMLAFFAATSWVGWLLLIMSLQTKRETRQRSETENTRATGTIVDYARGERRNGRRGVHVYWKPVVEFTADGRKYRAEYPNQMDRERFPTGTEVDVLYCVSDPLRFHLAQDPVFVDSGRSAMRFSLILIATCAALTLLLAVLVGGLRIDFAGLWYRVQRLFHSR